MHFYIYIKKKQVCGGVVDPDPVDLYSIGPLDPDPDLYFFWTTDPYPDPDADSDPYYLSKIKRNQRRGQIGEKII